MFKLKESFLMFVLAFVSIAAYGQSLTVTGKVMDSEGYEVIGGSVTVKGAAGVGTVTDINGNYTLKAVSYTHLTLPTTRLRCRSRWSPYH